jgi:hypothetical protein
MADTYSIVGQQQVLDASDVTNPHQAMQVTFRSAATGVTGTVIVSLADYSPQEVNRLIAARVATIDAVHEL